MCKNPSTIESLPLLMDVKTAADIANVTPKHIYSLLNKGAIKGCKLGKAVRINRDAFLAYIGLA